MKKQKRKARLQHKKAPSKPLVKGKEEKSPTPVKALRRAASVEPAASSRTPKASPKPSGPLAAEDLEKGMDVLVVPAPEALPLEGFSQGAPYRGTITEVVRRGTIKGKKTTNPVKLDGKGEVIGAYATQADKKGWSGFVALGELFPASYTPPTAAKTTKAGKPRVFKPHENPTATWAWSTKGKPEFSWDQKTKEPKVAWFPREFKLSDMIAAAKEAGSSRPEGRAKFIIKTLLRKHKIKSVEVA